MSIQTIVYRLRYYRRVILLALGRCPKCRARVNYTTSGKPVCPDCGL